MKVTVIGTGFVGVVTSAVMAHLGHKVIGLDLDLSKTNLLNSGKAPFFEPDLDTLLESGLKSNNLQFTTDYKLAIGEAEIIIICVGTPSAKDGTADLTYLFDACESMAPYLKEKAIVVIKSTVPPGTNDKAEKLIKQKTDVSFWVASVPEFLREGKAVKDTLNPDRIVIGTADPFVINKLLKLHEGLGGERVVVSSESAQMAKYTANAYLAQRITFINQIANLCEKNGAKISEVVKVIGYDKRIGAHYWYPGLGYGGSCFPKDVKELAAYAKTIGEAQGLLPKIDQLNEERIEKKLDEYQHIVGGFKNKKIAVLGLSFKPDTNDVRFAPSLYVVPYLQERGAKVSVYDPQVKTQALEAFPGVIMALNAYQASSGAQVIILLTEWAELTKLDLNKLAEGSGNSCWFIDTRNQYSAEAVNVTGMRYIGIGNG